MITVDGYSKDASILPEGIAITFGKEMLCDHGGIRVFLKSFVACLENEDCWIHFCKNKPVHDVLYVYIIISNRLAYRCQFVGLTGGGGTGYKANGDETQMKPGIMLGGPLIRAPYRRKLKGFQGFRYTQKLF
jgi:hypothetical protein